MKSTKKNKKRVVVEKPLSHHEISLLFEKGETLSNTVNDLPSRYEGVGVYLYKNNYKNFSDVLLDGYGIWIQTKTSNLTLAIGGLYYEVTKRYYCHKDCTSLRRYVYTSNYKNIKGFENAWKPKTVFNHSYCYEILIMQYFFDDGIPKTIKLSGHGNSNHEYVYNGTAKQIKDKLETQVKHEYGSIVHQNHFEEINKQNLENHPSFGLTDDTIAKNLRKKYLKNRDDLIVWLSRLVDTQDGVMAIHKKN